MLPILRELARASRSADGPVLVVGGAVRDLLMGRVPRDLDISAASEQVVREISRTLVSAFGGSLVLYGAFGTVTVWLGSDFRVDLCTMRREDYATPGALPRVQPGGVLDDLVRRDFRVNSMALSPAAAVRLAVSPGEPCAAGRHASGGCRRRACVRGLIDPLGGLLDLHLGRITANRGGLFEEDPTRVLRACALRAVTGFSLEAGTAAELHDSVRRGGLDAISGDRVREALLYSIRAALAAGCRAPAAGGPRAVGGGSRRGSVPAAALCAMLQRLRVLPGVVSGDGDRTAAQSAVLRAVPPSVRRVTRILGWPTPAGNGPGGAHDVGGLGLAALLWGAGERAAAAACQALALSGGVSELVRFAALAEERDYGRAPGGGHRRTAGAGLRGVGRASGRPRERWTELLGPDPARTDRRKVALALAACEGLGLDAARASLIEWMLAAGNMLWDDDRPGAASLAEELVRWGASPGPGLGEAVRAARSARLGGILRTREEEISLAKAYLRGGDAEGDTIHA